MIDLKNKLKIKIYKKINVALNIKELIKKKIIKYKHARKKTKSLIRRIIKLKHRYKIIEALNDIKKI